MDKIIEMLPSIIFQIVLGAVFVETFFTYYYIEDTKPRNTNKILVYYIVGYVIYEILSIIPFSINKHIDKLGMIGVSFLCAMIIGRVYMSRLFYERILPKIGLNIVVNRNMWQYLIDENFPILVTATYGEKTYSGILNFPSGDLDSPVVSLGAFVVYKNGTILSDARTDKNKTIVIDLSKADDVVVEYNDKSHRTDELKEIIDYNVFKY